MKLHAAEEIVLGDNTLINKYEEYIRLLGEELNELASMAIIRGWKSTRVEKGIQLRDELKILKEQYEKDTIEKRKFNSKEKLYKKNFC